MNRTDQRRPADQPASSTDETQQVQQVPMAPGDEAPRGTPGTGENVCRRCGGKGEVDGEVCPECQGSGTVIEGIGGA
jgi:RecJ-like exonuclease